MEFLPRSMGTRPRLACEVRAEGVVAARAEDASGLLSAVSRAGLADGEGTGVAGRAATVAAMRRALEAVALRAREVTLVVPDAAVRVLLLDFDTLPSKPVEALPVVRFRLKKLLPFDADDAAVSYQVMATAKDSIHVLGVAMPKETLAEYEGMVREAGFEPGAVLPSTLAALAGLIESEEPTLVVNAGQEGVTTAIVKAGVLLLHRTVDLGVHLGAHLDANLGTETFLEPGGVEFAAGGTAVLSHGAVAAANEVAQAVSVASAYFEDTLQGTPEVVLATGTLGAEALGVLLAEASVGIEIGPVVVREMVDRQMLDAGATSAGTPGGVPLGWLAGVRGALAN
jgi:type IV pilus assembly protein PilM